MSTSTITGIVKDSTGTAIASVPVVARLRPSGFRTSDYAELVDVTTSTDAAGAWSLALERNTSITPTNTYYEIEEQIPAARGGPRTWAITVSADATLFASLLSGLIPAAANPTALTQTAGDARYALINGPWRLYDTRSLVVGTTGSAGGGNGAVSAAVSANLPTTFGSGTCLVGSDTTHAVMTGDLSAYVGYYYVATSVSNNPSVPIISASYNSSTNKTTLVFSTIIGNTTGTTFEVSMWPGGTSGRAGTSGTLIVYKPTSARTVFQVGPNLALYQMDDYGTLALIGLNGTGANDANHLRDMRVADIGVNAVECSGTPANTSPGVTEASNVGGWLGYNGSNIKTFRDNINSPRSKSFSVAGETGETSVWAAAATSGTTTRNSPKLRMVGDYWDGAASQDRVAYLHNSATDTSGGQQLTIGFENRGSPSLVLQDAATAILMPYTDNTLQVGGTSNRLSQVIASSTGFRVWAASGAANPVAELKSTGIAFGAGGGSAVDTLIARAAAGFVAVPMLVKAGVPGDGDFAVAPPNGTVAINSSTDKLYYRKAGVWTIFL